MLSAGAAMFEEPGRKVGETVEGRVWQPAHRARPVRSFGDQEWGESRGLGPRSVRLGPKCAAHVSPPRPDLNSHAGFSLLSVS